MTVDAARNWLILGSLILSGFFFLFFGVGPALGYPLAWGQSFRLLQITAPVFFGYIGSAAHFIFRVQHAPRDIQIQGSPELFKLLVRGPVILFSILMLGVLFAFGFSNRPAAGVGTGMSVDSLSLLISTSMGLLAITTNVAVGYLFSVATRK